MKNEEIYLISDFMEELHNIGEINEFNEIKKNIKECEIKYLERIKRRLNEDEYLDIDEIDNTIEEKIEKYSKIYCKTKRYKEIDRKINDVEKDDKKSEENKIKIIKELVYEKGEFDYKSAYRIGMAEGIKITTLANK